METFILKQLNEWKRYFQEGNCKMRADGPCVWQHSPVGVWEMQGGRNLDVERDSSRHCLIVGPRFPAATSKLITSTVNSLRRQRWCSLTATVGRDLYRQSVHKRVQNQHQCPVDSVHPPVCASISTGSQHVWRTFPPERLRLFSSGQFLQHRKTSSSIPDMGRAFLPILESEPRPVCVVFASMIWGTNKLEGRQKNCLSWILFFCGLRSPWLNV